jgi:hypothetical protein
MGWGGEKARDLALFPEHLAELNAERGIDVSRSVHALYQLLT